MIVAGDVVMQFSPFFFQKTPALNSEDTYLSPKDLV